MRLKSLYQIMLHFRNFEHDILLPIKNIYAQKYYTLDNGNILLHFREYYQITRSCFRNNVY